MDNTLRSVLKVNKISGRAVMRVLEPKKIISTPTFFKYLDDPQHYTFFQMKKIASIIGIDHTELLIDLELI